jgi:deoxyadenosine/deoxycytidine kinase
MIDISKKNSFDEVTKKKSLFFTIEGNIGAGKSTFLKKISESLNCSLLLEPCHEWQNINGHNLLDEFYKDIKRWSYSFQLYAFLTRIESIESKLDACNDDYFIAERSIFADRYVFADVCYNDGYMTELEWNMYTKWFDWTIKRKNRDVLPSAIIYLQVSPTVSRQRINIRGREEEKNIPMEYLESLHNNHNAWLIEKKNIHQKIVNIPTLVLDCDQDFENNSVIWENMVYLVKNFINENFKNNFFYKELKYGNNFCSK